MRAGRAGPLLLLAATAAPVAFVSGGAAGRAPGAGGPSVIVRDQRGITVARAALPADGRFALAYRHSYYRAPAQERFVRDGAGFRLESVASPRAAVLDYYALPGRRGRDGRWLTLRPRDAAHYRRLALIGTPTGRRTLVVGAQRIPLYGPRPRHLTIAVEAR
jgi:hypothetical protein